MIMSELAQAFARVLNTWAEVLHALHVACLDIVPYCYYSRWTWLPCSLTWVWICDMDVEIKCWCLRA